MFQSQHRGYINKSATLQHFIYIQITVENGCLTEAPLVLRKAGTKLVWGAYENEHGVFGRYSWRVGQVFKKEQKKSHYTGWSYG